MIVLCISCDDIDTGDKHIDVSKRYTVKLSTYGRRSFTASGPICGTASPNTSETQHYPLIRLGANLKHTVLLDINIHTKS